jgi:uncharacterized protein with HEPN domain
MPPERSDAALLWDMLDSARAVVAVARPLSFEQYLVRRTERRAIERELEIIGEAARHVSESFRKLHPHIPWNQIAAQRHRLSHEYGEIKHDLIWRVVTVHIPELIKQLEPLIPAPPPPPPEGAGAS